MSAISNARKILKQKRKGGDENMKLRVSLPGWNMIRFFAQKF